MQCSEHNLNFNIASVREAARHLPATGHGYIRGKHIRGFGIEVRICDVDLAEKNNSVAREALGMTGGRDERQDSLNAACADIKALSGSYDVPSSDDTASFTFGVSLVRDPFPIGERVLRSFRELVQPPKGLCQRWEEQHSAATTASTGLYQLRSITKDDNDRQCLISKHRLSTGSWRLCAGNIRLDILNIITCLHGELSMRTRLRSRIAMF